MKKAPVGSEAAAPPPPPAAYGAASMVDLEEWVHWDACDCLNRTPKSSIANILKQGLRDQQELLLESDADEQLLLTITFKTHVSMRCGSRNGAALLAPSENLADISLDRFDCIRFCLRHLLMDALQRS